jgi:ATP-dependent Lhr-like helicase
MSWESFHPIIAEWFAARFSEPTEPQRLGWPHIAAGRHTLIAAPTGSGKTLAAFLVCLDRLLRQWLDGQLADGIQVVYVSPLKALSNDIHRNLEVPLAEISRLVEAAGHGTPPIRTAVRTGDTPASQRQAMLRRPPHILVTTPESLYLLLTSEKSRETLRTVKTVIVDEIHALARDKRGSHLSLSLERLAALCDERPVRIGLSATQRPIDQIAEFLVGGAETGSGVFFRVGGEGDVAVESSRADTEKDSRPHLAIIDVGHVRNLDLAIETPPSELSAVCSHEQWAEIYQRMTELVQSHRSTLIFVNTRRLAERVAHNLRDLLGPEAVASHHGSLSRAIRLSAEERLKAGELKAIVATASLEMGIDIGYIDLVCQIGSCRAIAACLQRVGRSGHSLGATPKGRLFPLTRDELLENMALVRAVRRGDLDRIEIPELPLDILAQQIVAAVACEEWDEQSLYNLCRRAWPFRNLTTDDFEAIVNMLSEGVAPSTRRGAYLHRDRIGSRLRARRSARLAALTSGGAIPETAQYRVVTEPEGTFVGTVDEDFAIESIAGDVFLLGNTSWRVRYVRGGEVLVRDAEGAPPSIPFWLGEAPSRTVELSAELSRLRSDIAARLGSDVQNSNLPEYERDRDAKTSPGKFEFCTSEPVVWLQHECGVDARAADQAVRYVEAQQAAIGMVPTNQEIVFERFFDESGGMQLVIHSPLGARINRAWGLALRKRFCRSFDFELQAAANDNGIVLSLSPQHSFPIEQLFKMLGPHNARDLLEQALLAVPMFQVRWRWNVTRALAVLRHQHGKKVPPHLQRFRADDLLAATFPETVGCLENHHGDIKIPDHPLVRQTMHDCLHEAMDLDRWLSLLEDVQAGRVRLIPRDTREPSPFSYELLNANPYAFLDGAALEERRTRAVATRRTLSADDVRDLAKLDPEAIAEVTSEAWPLVRSADELHDALMSLVLLHESEGEPWRDWFNELIRTGRAAHVTLECGDSSPLSFEADSPATENPTNAKAATSRRTPKYWIAAERWPVVAAAYPDAIADPPVTLPVELATEWPRADAWVELVRGRIQCSGPVMADNLADLLSLEPSHVTSALEALEAQGIVLRGHFSIENQKSQIENAPQWCDRRLLARIHRLTLTGLRRQIQPVEPAVFLRYLLRHHRLTGDNRWGGPVGVREVIGMLQGFELPAGAWEHHVLAARVADYDPQWLDHLFLSGEAMWGRLRPPRRDEQDGPSMAALTRTVPISLLLREDLAWLLPAAESAPTNGSSAENGSNFDSRLRSNARQVLEALTARGALFLPELKTVTGLLPAHLEDALRELAALGLITSDAFAAVRTIVDGAKNSRGRHRRRGSVHAGLSAPAGRWSRFPGAFEPPPREQYLEKWCRQLLRRYGVLFRDLLTRESAAPAWYELVPVLRRLELRGELRGGRFVAQVAGEQYATESAVEQLRQMRDQPPDNSWQLISAADPLNLIGIITDGPRIPATHKNAVILKDGRCLAAKQAGQITFFQQFDLATEADVRRALQVRRQSHTVHRAAAELETVTTAQHR